MRYRVLGPLGVAAHEADLPLGGRQQRLVLALLIAANGRTVSTAQLIDDVWGEDPPPTARKALQVHVHHLREQVGDALSTEMNGYSLQTDGVVDAVEFERVRAEAVELLESDPARASELLGNALGLWSGPAYADLTGELALTAEIARLEDLRALALGDRIDADLALGRHGALIGELEGLTHEYSLHERFRAQLMTALYRAGRHVEALRSYERFRRHLADEMGLEPSTDLRGLESRILAGDESLKGPEVGPGAPMAVRGYELREVVARERSSETYRAYQRSVGREVAVRVLGPELADDPRFIADFVSDTKAVAALEHPHICFVFDTWREPGHAYQVSRWLGGGSLFDALADGPMSMSSTLQMLDEIGGALGHAHREGVVHGRLAPSNVLFDDSGHAYLSGFAVGSGNEDDAADDRVDLAALAHLALTTRLPRRVNGAFEAALADTDLKSGVRSAFEVAFSADGYARPEHFTRALRQASGLDVTAPVIEAIRLEEVRNPFKGLQSFQESDAADFFGRDDLIERVAAELDRNRLVAVVGPSGSGKSSAVKAGLLPTLRARAGGPLTLISEMYPGAYPFEELEDALLRVGVDRASILSDLVGDERGLARVLKHILPTDDAELVLVIDQFEELFSMVSSEETRQLFLDSLVAATSDPRSRLRVVLTMRADFFDRPLGYPNFGEVFEAALVPVRVPDDQQLAMAISQPAHSVGVDFEEGLIGQIVQDVGGQPGSLPLLQYALTELFDDRDSGTITLATYQRGGGVFGALGRRAEALYGDLTEPGKRAIRQAFLRMVTVEEGSDDLRRRVRRSQLHVENIDDGALTVALQLYGAHRLLTFDLDPVTSGPTVEVAHEALIRQWPRLGGWIDEHRDDLVVRKRIDAALTEWKSSGEEASYLPSGGRLAQFQEWSADTLLSVTAEERRFLAAAVEIELATAARAQSRRKRLTIGLVGVAASLAVLAVVAFAQKRVADSRESETAAALELAETRRIGADAAQIVSTNRRIGLLLAAEAYRREPGYDTLGDLQRVLTSTESFLGYLGGSRKYGQLAWAGSERIVGMRDSGVDVYDIRTGELTVELEIDTGEALDVNTEAGLIAVGTASGPVRLFDLESGQRVGELAHDAVVRTVRFSPSGDRLATGDRQGTLRLWDTSDGSLLGHVEGHPERSIDELPDELGAGEINLHEPATIPIGVQGLAFDATGMRLVSTGGFFIRVWNGSDLGKISEIFVQRPRGGFEGERIPGRPFDVVFDGPDRVRVATEDFLQTWDLATGNAVGEDLRVTSSGTSSAFESFSLDVDGDLAVAGLADGAFRLIDLQSQDVKAAIPIDVGVESQGFDVALAPDGRVVAAAADGIVLFSLDGRQLLAEAVPVERELGLAELLVSNDGSLATTLVGIDSVVWDLADGPTAVDGLDGWRFWPGIFGALTQQDMRAEDALLIQLDPVTRRTTGVTFGPFVTVWMGAVSPDDRLVAVGLGRPDRPIVKILDARSGTEIASLNDFVEVGHELIGSLSFSPDGTRLAAASKRGTAFVWNAQSWERVGPAIGGVTTVAYSPDGELLVTANDRGDLMLRDSRTSQPVGIELLGATRTVGNWRAIGFSDDGSLLTTQLDSRPRMYSLETGALIGQAFPGDTGTSVNVSSDGRYATSIVGEHGLIWNLDIDRWFEIACRAAGRNLRVSEWQQFGPTDEPYEATCPLWDSLSG